MLLNAISLFILAGLAKIGGRVNHVMGPSSLIVTLNPKPQAASWEIQ